MAGQKPIGETPAIMETTVDYQGGTNHSKLLA